MKEEDVLSGGPVVVPPLLHPVMETVACRAQNFPVLGGVVQLVMVHVVDLENTDLLSPAATFAAPHQPPVGESVARRARHSPNLGHVDARAFVRAEAPILGPPCGAELERLATSAAELEFARLHQRGRMGALLISDTTERAEGTRETAESLAELLLARGALGVHRRIRTDMRQEAFLPAEPASTATNDHGSTVLAWLRLHGSHAAECTT